MKRTLWWYTLLGAALLLASIGESASAAIRVTITDSVNTKVFYSADSQTGLISTSLGDWEVLLNTVFSNFSGQDAGGVLSQTINLSDSADPGTGILPTLFVTADIIGDLGIASGEVTGGNLALVTGAEQARWTLPTGSSLLVSSDISSAEPQDQAPTGTVQNHTTVNGTTVSSLEVPINGSIEAELTGSVANGPEGYTLSSQVVLEGANVGSSGIAIGASSSVRGGPGEAEIIPEPGSIAVLSLGAIGLVLSAARRRFGRQAA